MKVLYLAAHPVEGPSTRFRVTQFFPYLQQQGMEPVLLPFFTSAQARRIYFGAGTLEKLALTLKSGLRRCGELLERGHFDVIYILREGSPYAPAWFELLFKGPKQKLIFDFDDAIYFRSLVYTNPLDRLRDWDKPGKIISASEHVIAGNEHLKKYATRFISADKVTVLPTVVDTEVFCPNLSSVDRPPIVGWIGTPRGSAYLQDLIPCYQKLVQRFPTVQFLFVGAEPFPTQGLPIRFKPWKLEEEIHDIQSFTVGLMPLTDDEETKGKCGFKLIEYMACGVVPISSPVGENRNIVAEGETGFFAQSPEEWYEKISQALVDKTLAKRICYQARAVAVEKYSLAAVAPRHFQILRQVAG